MSASPKTSRPSTRKKIQAFFDEALGAQKKAWGTCDGCRKKVEVDVPDWNARAKVLEMLLNQGYGRPRSEEEESRKGFILHRSIVLRDVDYGHIVELVEKHGVGSLRPLPRWWRRSRHARRDG